MLPSGDLNPRDLSPCMNAHANSYDSISVLGCIKNAPVSFISKDKTKHSDIKEHEFAITVILFIVLEG